MIHKPVVKFNCSENWDSMKVGLISRYCDACKRDVHDFTKMTREEILQFLWLNRNTKICGRIHKSQLDYHHEEILITINAYIQKNKSSNSSFYLLAIGAMMVLGCSVDNNQVNGRSNDPSVYNQNIKNEDSGEHVEVDRACKIDALSPDEFSLGDIILDDTLLVNSAMPMYGEKGVRLVAEVMPEFVGGFDSLLLYIKENLKYPDWERTQGIEGNVIVTFVVDTEGKIREPGILKSVPGSRNFDKEVLRFVMEMPDWRPGQEHGQNVPVRFTLPIQFKL